MLPFSNFEQNIRSKRPEKIVDDSMLFIIIKNIFFYLALKLKGLMLKLKSERDFKI